MAEMMVRGIAGDQHTQEARAYARKVLSESTAFPSLSFADQQSVYKSLVQEYIDKRTPRSGSGNGYARSMATDSGKDMGYKGYDPGFQGDTQAFNELVESVDFPKFVADLLKAVFDANLTVMKQQTDSYIKLMKECTKSSADFIKQVKDEDTFGALIEKHSNKYNLSNERQSDGTTKLNLTTPDGDKVDLEDAEVHAGLDNPLVVDKGVVEAGVDFSIKA